MHRNRRHIDADAREDCPKRSVIRPSHQIVHEDISLHEFHDDAEEHEISAQRMHQKIADTGAPARRPRVVPNQEGRGHRLQFPEEQERNPIMSQHDADGRADISHRTESFERALVVAAVNSADDAENAENHGENPAERIDVKVMDGKVLEELEL